MSWICRDANKAADFYSRVVDYDDWGIDPHWFSHIVKHLGHVDIDRFASKENRKTMRFNSRYFDPSAEATDAFTQHWGYTRNWLVPPIYMITRVIDYLQLCQGFGILVVPKWESAYFWPTIRNILNHETSHVSGQMLLGDIFKQYGNQNSIFGLSAWHSQTLAIALDYRPT